MKISCFTHAVSANQVAGEIERIVTVLEKNGYATIGMDFTDLVARKLSDEFAQKLQIAGARIKNHNWELKSDRSLSVKIYLPHEEDLALITKFLAGSKG
ncbi:MAG: hypothetical protein ORN52_13100 [Beijerinckiaceae bacterium]|nr:hypothetical protein [Beijerinckiaceae bacterium]